MSFSVDIRSIEELAEDQDDPLRKLVIDAYKNRPLSGQRTETFFQFSYEALPPERTRNVLGDIGDREAIGLLVDELPKTDPDDPFRPEFFSVTQLARGLAERYPEVESRSLEDVYRGYESGQFNDEQVFASVLMDFARNPLSGYPVVVFGW
ncbi:MAG TPA: hypothetical protein VGY55_03910 [Pirellulales bacterium]|jgi:hypothetical protein|nr:hypothetical protein [Pirellulales bacterium]